MQLTELPKPRQLAITARFEHINSEVEQTMKKKLEIVAIALSFVVFGVAPNAARAEFGAFAYDSDSGKYGVAWNERDQRAADQAAMKGCASDKCKVVFQTVAKQCGAIAMTDNGKVWGGAKRDQRAAAELAAIQNCQGRTSGQCKIKGSECNR